MAERGSAGRVWRMEEEAGSSFIHQSGETDGNAKRIFQPAEIPLNAHGLAQAEAASGALQAHRLERSVASTMSRGWTTAGIIGRPPQM